MESIEFVDDVTVRRNVSVDFTLPGWFLRVPYREGPPVTHLAPIALLAKEPLTAFDLRDEGDNAVPLLTRAQNTRVASAGLIFNAARLLQARGRMIEPELVKDLRGIAGSMPAEAEAARERVLAAEGRARVNRALLAEEPRFRRLMRDLVANFIVLAAVDGRRRRVLKFSYEEPLRAATLPRLDVLLEQLGWRAKQIIWSTPSIGFSASYHVEIVAPRDLEVVSATLVARDARGRSYVDSVGACGARAHLYREGLPPDTTASASVQLRARRAGLLRAWTLLAFLTAGLLTAISLRISSVTNDVAAATTVLVVIPGLLSAYLTRPGEHELVTTILIGLRRIVVFTGLVAVVAATSLLIGLKDSTLSTVWWALVGLAWGAAAILGVSYFLPRLPEEPRSRPRSPLS